MQSLGQDTVWFKKPNPFLTSIDGGICYGRMLELLPGVYAFDNMKHVCAKSDSNESNLSPSD